jgi:dTDP-4-dehydrorhamnose reductase
MKILISGAGGQLGLSLRHVLRTRDYDVIYLDRHELDITDSDAVYKIVSESKPNVVINAAAYTNVELAELEPEKAFAINERGARNLAKAAGSINSKLLHFSTDYVFSGANNKPWEVNDEKRPLSSYGKSKLAGENAIIEEIPDSFIIIRTAWLYSPFGKNFYKSILKLALINDEPISVVNDQFGQPTNAEDLSNLAISALENKVKSGIFHGTNSGSASWYDFAVEIFNLAGSDINRVKAISTKDYKSKAVRPEYSVLDNSKWVESGVVPLCPWKDSVARAFPSIQNSLN